MLTKLLKCSILILSLIGGIFHLVSLTLPQVFTKGTPVRGVPFCYLKNYLLQTYKTNIIKTIVEIINNVGSPKVILKSDQEPAMIDIQKETKRTMERSFSNYE